MHTLGKVFLGLTLLCAVGAVVLTTQLLNVRNSWMQKIADAETRIETNDGQLATKRRELATLRDELVRRRLTWDRLAVAQQARPDAEGRVTVGIGPDQGFAVVGPDQAPPIVHAFADAPGGAVYVGPFRVTTARGSQSLLEPLFTVGTGEPQVWQSWGANAAWHLWQSIPSEGPSRLPELKRDIVSKTEARDARQATLALQTKAAQQAEQHLESRTAELFGSPTAVKVEGAPEFSDGWVAALAAAETERNAALAELDRLRHAADRTYEALTRTLDENRALAAALPKAGAARTAEVSASK